MHLRRLATAVSLLVTSVAVGGPRQPVVGPGAATGAGFASADTTIAPAMAGSGGVLYAGTLNIMTGTEVWVSGDGLESGSTSAWSAMAP